MDNELSYSDTDRKAEELWQNFDGDNDHFWLAYEQLLESIKPEYEQTSIARASPVEIPLAVLSQTKKDMRFDGDFHYVFSVEASRKKQLLDKTRREATEENIGTLVLGGVLLGVTVYITGFYMITLLFLGYLGFVLKNGRDTLHKQKKVLDTFFVLTPKEITISGRKIPLYNITRLWNDEGGFNLYKDIEVREEYGLKTKYVPVVFVPCEIDNYSDLRTFFAAKVKKNEEYIGWSDGMRASHENLLKKRAKKKQQAAQPKKPQTVTQRKAQSKKQRKVQQQISQQKKQQQATQQQKPQTAEQKKQRLIERMVQQQKQRMAQQNAAKPRKGNKNTGKRRRK